MGNKTAISGTLKGGESGEQCRGGAGRGSGEVLKKIGAMEERCGGGGGGGYQREAGEAL